MGKTWTVSLQWAVMVEAALEVEAETAEQAAAEAMRRLNEDEAFAQDAAEDAWDRIRQWGPEAVATHEAVGPICAVADNPDDSGF